MHLLAAIVGILLMVFVLMDAFEALILPRSANSNLRITFFFYRLTWKAWRWIAAHLKGSRREQHLWVYGPLSMIMLLALWALLLVLSFGILQWAAESHVVDPVAQPSFASDLYMSGATFFTLGYGDVVPRTPLTRFLSIAEAGMGIGFLAMVIGYLPVLYQAFSRREVTISNLVALAGSPPTELEMARRQGIAGTTCGLGQTLSDWEQWAAELLESHLSYPVLVFYRSQHDRQSWLASLTAVLDTCAVVIASGAIEPGRQAKLTFAMARHAIIDLTLILNQPPIRPTPERMTERERPRILQAFTDAGLPMQGDTALAEFARMRDMYEPYLFALGLFLAVEIPRWSPNEEMLDNWESSAWERTSHFHP